VLADYQALVDDLVRDKDQVIISARRDVAIANAVSRYSQDASRELVRDVTSDGTTTLPVPMEWSDEISDLISIEYPIGNFPTSLLGAQDFYLYVSPSETVIRLGDSPNNGDDLRVTFTTEHLLDDTHDTIPLKHQRAVACLAAGDLCGQLAAYYATESAPTIGADVSDHQGKTERYRKRSADLLAEYQKIVGPAPSNRAKPASATAQLDQNKDSLGRPRMFHPTRNWPPTP